MEINADISSLFFQLARTSVFYQIKASVLVSGDLFQNGFDLSMSLLSGDVTPKKKER